MRLHRDNPALETPVRWYRVPWDRPALGLPTLACSSTWDDSPLFPDLGEMPASRRWWAGAPPPFVPVGDPDPVGTPEQWLAGL